MRRVLSRNEDDCGVCALATWAGVSYGLAAGLIHPTAPVDGYGTWAVWMANALTKLGYSGARSVRCASWALVPPGRMVIVEVLGSGQGKDEDFRHWCVKGLNGALIDNAGDPAFHPPGNYRVVSYMEVDDG